MEEQQFSIGSRRRAASVVSFFGSALAFGGGLSYLAWSRLPYEELERFTREEEFIVWEGVVWLFALLLTFLGASIILERAGWNLSKAVKDLRRSFGDEGGVTALRPDVVPWWMLTAGMILMIIGFLARVILAP